MGFSLKSLIFNDVEDEEEEVVEVVETPKKEEPQEKPHTTVVSESGKPDAKIAEKLSEAVGKANLDGYDYFEFAKAIQSIGSSIPAESVRYQAAFSAGAAMGCTPDKLVETAKHYLGVLDQEEGQFQEAMKAKLSGDVEQKKSEAENTLKTIQEKQEAIKAMTEEINNLHEQRAVLLNEANTNEVNVRAISNNFSVTIQAFRDRITSDIAKIQKYLGKKEEGSS